MEFVKSHMAPQRDLATDGEVLRNLWQTALTSLQSLQSPVGVTASGPDGHFHAIFGRDSLWTVLLALEAGRLLRTKEQGLELLDGRQQVDLHQIDHHQVDHQFDREIDPHQVDRKGQPYIFGWLHDLAGSVLRGLARLQGQVVNDFNEEQPGRIVHEYWNPVPERMIAARWPVMINGCYYGSFDATFLYLITIAQVDAFFDDAHLLEELWPSVELALQWMLTWSDLDGDGLVESERRTPEGIGLDNQVWKDSSESLHVRDRRVQHPIAWIEVQGYAWAAYTAYSELAKKRRSLDTALHQEIQQRMSNLQKGLQCFWLDDEQCPALALEGDKRPIPVVASNAGHLLWSACLEQEQAVQIAARLLQPDMLTPWGLRTLSEKAYYYNPLSYHCGSIWPFDNAVVAIGLQKYGFDAEAHRIAKAVLEAMLAFDKPVELYTVQPSRWIRSHRIEQDWFLADYFRACDVQAWTAAAILYFTALLI